MQYYDRKMSSVGEPPYIKGATHARLFYGILKKISPKLTAEIDHLTYRPFKGAPTGWQLRLGKKLGIKKWEIGDDSGAKGRMLEKVLLSKI